jgi:hypothetical protein
MKRRVHIDAIKAEFKNLFSEWVLIDIETDGQPSKKNVFRAIDTRDKEALSRLKANRLSYYLKQHPDNTEQLFIETTIDKAKELQTYFPDFKGKTEDKEHYYSLQRWIDCLAAPKNEIDARYWIASFFDKQVQTTHEYKGFKRDIENNGSIVINTKTDTAKIYTPELAVFFTSKELPARNMDTKTETTINGWEYLQTFIDAYKEGEQYFESQFKVSPSTLYGANSEEYVRDIHLNFFHVQHTAIHEGWGYVKSQYPFILTYKAIREFGYYSGIVNKVEEQVKKHPKLFATFEKCDHDTPLQGEAKQEKEFNELADRYKAKYGHEVPFGAFLFDEIKAKALSITNDLERLNEYKKQLHYWVNQSLTSSEIIGEVEVSDRLIPLIKNEIELLENGFNVSLPVNQIETTTDKLKAVLNKHGFSELPNVKQLSSSNKQSLIELISTNDLPYRIAMIEYLGLLKHLKSDHFRTDYKLFIEVAKWFEVDQRAVKGNIYVLNEKSKENRARYTAHLQKETVQKDYNELK